VPQREEGDRSFVYRRNLVEIRFHKPRGHQQLGRKAVRGYFFPIHSRSRLFYSSPIDPKISVDMLRDARMKEEVTEFVSDGEALTVSMVRRIDRDNHMPIFADDRTGNLLISGQGTQ